MTEADLLDGETLIQAKNANAVIKMDQHGLSRFAFDQLMWTVGMKGKEAIGGTIALTNYRLIYKSHSINRLTGKFSIFLPTIKNVSDASGFIVKKMRVATQTQQLDFVMWCIPPFLSQVISAIDAITPDQFNYIRTAAVKEFAKCGDGLTICYALEALNISILTAKKIAEIAEMAKTPIEVISILNLLQMFSDE